MDPLGNKWAYAYSTDNKNKLLSVTPPGETPGTSNTAKQVQLFYGENDIFHPMSVTRMVEPAADDNTSTAETIVEYYGPSDQSGQANGLVKRVTPPYSAAPVVTEFQYNAKGNLSREQEGRAVERFAATRPATSLEWGRSRRDLGRPGTVCNAQGCGETGYDGNGNASQGDCWKGHDSGGLEETEDVGYNEDCFPASATGCAGSSTGCAYCRIGFPNCTCDSIPHPKNPGAGLFRSATTCTNGSIQYNHMGQLKEYTRCLYEATETTSGPTYTRSTTFDYDQLGRPTNQSIQTDEGTGQRPNGTWYSPLTRGHVYAPDSAQGIFEEQGPDGTHTMMTLDLAGRPEYYYRWNSTGLELASAHVTYTNADQIYTVTYGNGSTVHYTYDNAARVRTITHTSGDGLSLHKLEYAWSVDVLITQITEYDESGTP
jgi:hypothetical protein